MNGNKTKVFAKAELRLRAEAKIAAYASESSNIVPTPQELSQVIHELRVHQIELEIQNEELRNAQLELETSRAKYIDLYDQAPVGYFTQSQNGIIVEVNVTLANLLGKSRADLLQSPVSSLFVADDQDIYYFLRKKIVNAVEALSFEIRMRKKDGSPFWARCDAKTTKESGELLTRVTVSDVTEKKLLEEQLIRTLSIESLGTLCGGIANDLNNILTGIFGYINLIQHVSKDNELALKYVSKAMTSFDLARDLTLQMEAFANACDPLTCAVDINQLLRETSDSILAKLNTVIDYELCSHLPLIEADANKIKQVVKNLLLNAKQAMFSGGKISISTQRLGEDTVRVIITDHDVVISDVPLSSVFDKVFAARGTGSSLRLAMAHSIITSHKGCIAVTSEPGKGTSFTIDFPCSKKLIIPKATQSDVLALKDCRILFLDNEPYIREIVEAMAEIIECRLELVRDGRDAIAAYDLAMQKGQPFDVVILDLTIPGGMGALDTLAEIKKLDPAVRAVVSSGYADYPVMARPSAFGFVASLTKPYQLGIFSEVMLKVLN